MNTNEQTKALIAITSLKILLVLALIAINVALGFGAGYEVAKDNAQRACKKTIHTTETKRPLGFYIQEPSLEAASSYVARAATYKVEAKPGFNFVCQEKCTQSPKPMHKPIVPPIKPIDHR